MEFTVTSTENVRKILQAECDAANFVLRPWIVESLVTQEVDENCCTCAPIPDANTQAEEIASSIEKALGQAQRFREAMSLKTAEAKRKNSKPTLQQIYSTNNLKSKSKIMKEKEIDNEAKSKNFIARNKMSVRNMSSKNSKSNNDLRSAGSSKNNLRTKSRYPSVTELDNLIKKFSLESSNSASSPSLESPSKNCRVHGDNQERVVTKKKLVTMDVMEALNHFGVPEELLKPLKIYNSYVNKQNDNQRKKGVNKFLNDLELFHTNQSESLASNNHVKLIKGFGELYRDLHETPENSASLKKKYFELDDLSKICSTKKYDTLRTRRSGANISKIEESSPNGWLHNGIWNENSYAYFSIFTRSLAIQYFNKKELLSLFATSQRLQQVLYQRDLNDLLVLTAVPLMKTLNPSSEEYLNLYKMIFTIAQVLNPKSPVLVRTDD